ncbi:8560_t:CDS:2 [Funneliformis geosporum]|uniref:8560_t:CDS:1 n=1 Tax=Funneliformis geosporum TaxID=1117311 RepID=A0A9W4SRW5_9GLOM|nr:8560_t:CDS:2 [Funneliformis geosporum]
MSFGETRELRKTTKTNWLKDNRELLRNNNGQVQTDIRLTTKWLERSKCEDLGIKYRKGRYTKQEKEILQKSLQEYKIRHNLNDDQLQKLMHYRNEKEHSSFWAEIGYRSLKSVAHHIQRNFHEFNHNGSWSKEEDEQLKQLIQLYGRDWTTIGEQLKRMPEGCKERYVICLQHQDKHNKGKWTKEEEEQLTKVVVDITKECDANISLDWGIPWQLVAEAMDNKRTALSCRKELNETDEYLIEWDKLADEEWELWPRELLCEHWRHLKYTVNGFREKDFQEILYELLNRYNENTPEKPNRPKSAPTINSEDDTNSDYDENVDNVNNNSLVSSDNTSSDYSDSNHMDIDDVILPTKKVASKNNKNKENNQVISISGSSSSESESDSSSSDSSSDNEETGDSKSEMSSENDNSVGKKVVFLQNMNASIDASDSDSYGDTRESSSELSSSDDESSGNDSSEESSSEDDEELTMNETFTIERAISNDLCSSNEVSETSEQSSDEERI